MIASIAALLRVLTDVGRSLVSMIRPPLYVRVRELHFHRVESDTYGPIIVLTAHPLSYSADVEIMNRASRTVFIKEIRLRIETLAPLVCESPPVRQLAPDDFTVVQVTFPVPSERAVRQRGVFVLEVEPSRGRIGRASGVFPVRHLAK